MSSATSVDGFCQYNLGCGLNRHFEFPLVCFIVRSFLKDARKHYGSSSSHCGVILCASG